MSDATAQPRVRQACEPCRRKKTKCPGEKPACSFCSRLNQKCTYVRESNASGIGIRKERRMDRPNGRDHAGDRLERLESRMDEVMEAVNTFIERQSNQSPSTRTQQASSPIPRATASTSYQQSFDEMRTYQTESTGFDVLLRPYPPPTVLQELVDVYIQRLSDQPLPLFDSTTLPSQAAKFSPALLNSFLALTVRLSTNDFYKDCKPTAVDFYNNVARKLLYTQVAEPIASLDVLQAFCLLCLNDIEDSRMVRAWMAVGVAARLAICTNLSMSETGRTVWRKSDISRCYWSLFILDRIHGSSFRTLQAISDESILPEMPPCARQPGSATLLQGASHEADNLSISEENDTGINSYALQLLSTWGRLMIYLKTIRLGNLEDAWTANSTYQQLKSEMSRFETVFPEAHRFKNARFNDRSTEELSNDREYWAPWIFTQCVYHTIYCTLNHPFLHVVRIHGRQRLRSPSFLQHTTDQAILHSVWVIRILTLAQERDFTIHDPFIGHLASIIATTQFFLRFSKDEALAAKAAKDFEQLRSVVETMAYDHPHLQHTHSKLTNLAQLANPLGASMQALNPPKVETALIWDLLDYAVSSSPGISSGASDNVELNVNTQFLSPPNQEASQQLDADAATGMAGPAAIMTRLWDETPLEFDMADFSDFPDMSMLTVPREAWTNGHL